MNNFTYLYRVINHFYNAMPSRNVIPLYRMINDTLINENYERLFESNITVPPLIHYRKKLFWEIKPLRLSRLSSLYRYLIHKDYAFCILKYVFSHRYAKLCAFYAYCKHANVKYEKIKGLRTLRVIRYLIRNETNKKLIEL